MSYVLSKINKINVSELSENWLEQIEELDEDAAYLLGSIERIVSWCEKILDGGKPQCLWALCDEGSDCPRAIVEMTNATGSKDPSFKFLNIHVEPRLILDFKQDIGKNELEALGKIIAYAFMESLKLALNSGSKKLKIYARTQEMNTLFDTLILKSTPEEGADLYRQGKWLVIEANR